MNDLNIFIFIALLTSAFSLFTIVFSIYAKPFRKATRAFIFLSVAIFLNSVFLILTLSGDNLLESARWDYFLEIIALFSPVLFFDFINSFLDNRLSEIKTVYKLSYLIIPAGISIYLLVNECIEVKKFSFGYMPVYEEQVLIGIFYFVPVYLLITSMILKKIFMNRRKKRYNKIYIIMAAGFLIFIFINIIYSPLGLAGIIETIPISSFLNLILYIFVISGILGSKYNIQNTTFRKIFENVDDIIMITDNNGKIVDFNRCPGRESHSKSGDIPDKMDDMCIKENLVEYSKKPEIINNFLKKLESSSNKKFRTDLQLTINGKEKIYDSSISIITDKNGSALGKLTILRDVTSNRFYQGELEKKSWVDYLTGAYNTRYIFERLEGEIKKYKRYKEPFCVFLMDIDNFKKYNDRFGHIKGDELLKDIVNLFQNNVREHIDVVGRYGGDEFIIILSRIGLDKARDMAARILEQLNRKSIEIISLSIGICEYDGNYDVDKLLRKADSLMYKAKKSGGNQIACN